MFSKITIFLGKFAQLQNLYLLHYPISFRIIYKIRFRYIPTDEGKYIHVPNPYIHIDNPYDGGYGPYSHDYEPYVGEETVDVYKNVLTPPAQLNPFYKEGYYRNNGIKIIRQVHNYDEDKYDFE